jgi:hypothetical protein
MDDFEPAEATDRLPWCLLVPVPEYGFTDPDIIGPFATYEDAHNWSLSYPGAIVRTMVTPEFHVLCRRQEYERKAVEGPRH